MGTQRYLRDPVAPLARHPDARILIVDDHPANVLLLERVLRAAGLERIHTLTDPRDAVARCIEIDADLVLLDLHMPHVDGFEILTALHAAVPADAFLPVIVLTGDATTQTRARALEAGATDFLTKPFDHTEVILRARNLLQTRSLYTGLQEHTRLLQAHLDAKEEEERRQTAEGRIVRERIDEILAAGAIEMVFQPIADLRTGRIRGVEALARFPREPLRPPNEWFDEATTVGRGNALELAAASSALDHLDDLPAEVFLAINVSPAAAIDPSLPGLLADRHDHRVVLEVTEHAPVDDYDELLANVDHLRARGVRIAVDDAGAGFAGLHHVLRLRPDILKLDITLTRDIDHDPARRALSTALVSFADEIGAVIIAEGIETEQELQTLRSLGISWGQGYHLARPHKLPLGPPSLTSIPREGP